MPSKNPAQRLNDILDNIAAIQSFVGQGSFEDLVGDLKTRYAVERALEVISEASRRLPQDLRNRHPGIDTELVVDRELIEQGVVVEEHDRAA